MNHKTLKYLALIYFSSAPFYACAGGISDHNHGDHHHGDHHDMPKHHMEGHHMEGHHMEGHGPTITGRPGTEDEVDRVITVEANDSMRFVHDPIKISNGETIKFEITNAGKLKHEFSVGTKDEHTAHSKMMMANPDMHHGPGGASITLEPGKTETLIWHFEEAWEVQVACNMPGHYQAGMHSDVSFDE